MAYNTSKKVVARMRRYLDDLHKARRTIRWPAQEPDVLARRIREGLEAVRHHKEFEAYADLKDFYTISVKDNHVVAVWKGVEELFGEPKQEATVEKPALTGVIVREDISTLTGVVGAAISYGTDAEELYFPKAVLDDEEKLTLFKWTEQELSWKYIDQATGGVTLTRKQVADFLLWKPEGES